MAKSACLVDAVIGYNQTVQLTFRIDYKIYLVTRRADNSKITFKILIERYTHNNPFEEGSSGDYRHYRTLPLGGPTYCNVRSAYERFLQNPALKRTFAP